MNHTLFSADVSVVPAYATATAVSSRRTEPATRVPTTDRLSRVTRVLVIANHPIVRLACSDLVHNEPGLRVCGEAEVIEGIARVRSLRPDLVIVDISFRDSAGVDLVRQVKARFPATGLLIVSAHDESRFVDLGLLGGTTGYVSKEEPTSRLIEAIHRLLRGENPIHDSAASRMRRRTVGRKAGLSRLPIDRLSTRELEAFRLLGQGYNTHSIAEHMGVSRKTAESYREHIKGKLKIRTAAELLHHAVQWMLDNG